MRHPTSNRGLSVTAHSHTSTLARPQSYGDRVRGCDDEILGIRLAGAAGQEYKGSYQHTGLLLYRGY